MAAVSASTPDQPRARRIVYVLAIGVATLVAARALLPIALRPILEWRGSELLGAPLDVEDLDLELWRGRVSLRGLALHAPPGVGGFGRDGDRPWLALRRLVLEIDWRAAWEGRIQLNQVELDEPRLELARAADGRLNLATLAAPPADAEGAAPDTGTGDMETGEAEAAEAETGGDELAIGVGRLRITGGTISFLDLAVGASSPIALRIDALELRDFSSLPAPGTPPTHLTLEAAVAEAPLEVEVSLTRSGDHVDLSGVVEVKALPLDQAQAYVQDLGLRGVSGTLDGTLRVDTAAGSAEIALGLTDGVLAQGGPDAEALQVEIGSAGLTLALEGANPWDLARGTGTIRARGELRAGALSLRSAEPDRFAAGFEDLSIALRRLGFDPGSTDRRAALDMELAEVAVAAPSLRLAYGKQGLPLPAVDAGSGLEEAPGDRAPPMSLRVRVDRVDLTRGAIAFVDRTVEPFARIDVGDLDVEADQLAWPEATAGELRVRADLGGEDPVQIEGAVASGAALRASLEAKRVPLAPLNPYATAFSGYAIERGTTSVRTTVTPRDGVYDAQTRIVLHDLVLDSAPAAKTFAERFGVPLSLGLALLRDARGDVTLDVPVEIRGAGGARLKLGSTIESALRQALVSAIASPLRVIGSVIVRGGEVEQFAPAPLPAVPGQIALAAAAEGPLDALGRVLAERPGLAVRLSGRASEDDARAISLEAARPPPEDLTEAAPLPTLEELARGRAQLACKRLREDHGIPADRIHLSGVEPTGPDAAPGTFTGVEVTLDAAAADAALPPCDGATPAPEPAPEPGR